MVDVEVLGDLEGLDSIGRGEEGEVPRARGEDDSELIASPRVRRSPREGAGGPGDLQTRAGTQSKAAAGGKGLDDREAAGQR